MIIKSDNINILQKIYIWALIFEPLKYFLLTSESSIGFALTIPKILQALVITLLFIYLISGGSIKYKNSFSRYALFFFFYLGIIFFSSIIALTMGNYNFSDNDNLLLKLAPFYNILVIIYYFTFFIIFPTFLINSKNALEYFIRNSWLTISIVIFLGLLDVSLSYFLRYDLICRHLVDTGCVGVGYRFHSILGEPRDAFVFIAYIFAFYGLTLFLGRINKISLFYCLLLIFLLIATQSASGIVGLVISLFLISIYGDLHKYKNLIYLFFIIIGIIIFFPFIFNYSDRLLLYWQEAKNLVENLDNKVVTDLILVQSPDIIPLWSYYNQIRGLEILNVLFGSGSGSSSYAINDYLSLGQSINNPRSNLVRILYSSGLVGMFFYLRFLILPIKDLIIRSNEMRNIFFLYSSLFLVGCTLSHRSLLGFIFIGILISILVNNLYERKFEKE